MFIDPNLKISMNNNLAKIEMYLPIVGYSLIYPSLRILKYADEVCDPELKRITFEEYKDMLLKEIEKINSTIEFIDQL